MNMKFIRSGVIAALALTLSACVVATPHPVIYRTAVVPVPTYVTQTQVTSVATPAATATPATPGTTTTTTTYTQPTAVQPAQVYIRPATPVVYVRPPLVYAAPIYVRPRIYY